MDERTETRALYLLALALALFGISAPYRWHEMPSWITNSALALALFLALWAICLSFPAPAKGRKKLLAALLIAGGITAAISGIVLYTDASPPSPIVFPKLEDYFAKDFNFLSLNQTISIHAQNAANGLDTTVDVQLRLFQDFSANTEFVALFVPFFSDNRLSEMKTTFFEHLKGEIASTRETLRTQIGTGGGSPGSPMTYSKDLIFSGRVFIYTMNPFDPVQIGELVSSYRKDGMLLEIRGSDYLFIRSKT